MDKFHTFMLSILATAFLAWAGVVWNTGEKLEKALVEFVIATEHRLTAVEKDVDDIKDHINRHRPNIIIQKSK